MGNCVMCSFSATTLPPEVDLALSIQLIHAKVLGFLCVEDLKACRLVSGSWSDIATPIFHERSRLSFRIDTRKPSYVKAHPEEATNKCVSGGIETILSRGKPPRNIQNLKFWIVNDEYPGYYFPNFYNVNASILELCKYYWKSLQELEYILPVNDGGYSACHLLTLKRILPKFSRLKKLKLVMTFGQCLTIDEGLFPDQPTTVQQLILQIESNWVGPAEYYWSDPDNLVEFRTALDIVSKDCANLPTGFPCLRTLIFERSAHPLHVGLFRQAILENEATRSNLKYLTRVEIRTDYESWKASSTVLQLKIWNLAGLSIRIAESFMENHIENWFDLTKTDDKLLWKQRSALTSFTLTTSSVKEKDFLSPLMPTDLIIPRMNPLTLNIICNLSRSEVEAKKDTTSILSLQLFVGYSRKTMTLRLFKPDS